MLIKIEKSYPSVSPDVPSVPAYTLFDNVDSILEFCAHPDNNLIHNEFAVDEHFIETRYEPIDEQLEGAPKVSRVNSITFSKNNKVYQVTFDTIAYICNDKGETLEKCFAGGIMFPA